MVYTKYGKEHPVWTPRPSNPWSMTYHHRLTTPKILTKFCIEVLYKSCLEGLNFMKISAAKVNCTLG